MHATCAIIALCALGLGGCFERPPNHVDEPTQGAPAAWAPSAEATPQPPGSYYPHWPDEDAAQTPDERAGGGTSDRYLWQDGVPAEDAVGLAPTGGLPSQASPLGEPPSAASADAFSTPRRDAQTTASEAQKAAQDAPVSAGATPSGVKPPTAPKSDAP